MIIYFVETESSDREFFREALPDDELRFDLRASEIPEDAEVLSIFVYTKIDADYLKQHPSLRLILTRSAGYDHIDLATCHTRGLVVCNVPNYGENTVAEHTFALILALSRRLKESIQPPKKRFSFQALRGFDLKGKTLGILGAGRIGLHTIRIAKAFGMKVIAHDPHEQDFIAEVLDFEYVSFDRLLAESDIISLHLRLNAASHHVMNKVAFEKCKPGTLLINTARGGLIDTSALIEALGTGQIGGAGLDVLEEERVMQKDSSSILSAQIIERLHQVDAENLESPQPQARQEEIATILQNKALISHPNVVFTPHTAGNSEEGVLHINQTTIASLKAFIQGQPINKAAS